MWQLPSCFHFCCQVSHHPMIVACHCEGTGWKFWGDSNLKSKFWGRSIQLDPVGILTLEFDDGEVFQWNKVFLWCFKGYSFYAQFGLKCAVFCQVTTSIYNLILGKLYCDHYGTMRVQGNHEYSCKLKFKEQSIIDRNPHQVLSNYRVFNVIFSLLFKDVQWSFNVPLPLFQIFPQHYYGF